MTQMENALTSKTKELAAQIEAAAMKLYQADQKREEIAKQLSQAMLERQHADEDLARLLPYSEDAQHLLVTPKGKRPVVITLVGEPEYTGVDCKVVAPSDIEKMAWIRLAEEYG